MNLSCDPGTPPHLRVNSTIRSQVMSHIQGIHSASCGAAPVRGPRGRVAVFPARSTRPAAPPAPAPGAAAPAVAHPGTDIARARAAGAALLRAGIARVVAARAWGTPAAVGVLLALVFAGMVLQVIAAGPFVAWDAAGRDWVYAHRAQGAMVTFLDVQAFVTGERWATVPVVMGVGAVLAHRRGTLRPLYAVMAGLATIAAIGYPVKFGLGRSSPVTGVDLLHAGGQAFPSGHAANTAFTATMVVFLLYGSAGLRPDRRRFRRGIGFVVALLAVSGTFVAWMGYHWLSDIPGGWLMGFIAVCVSLTVLHRPERAAGRDAEQTASEGVPADGGTAGEAVHEAGRETAGEADDDAADRAAPVPAELGPPGTDVRSQDAPHRVSRERRRASTPSSHPAANTPAPRKTMVASTGA